ncbi:hypothetical protein Tco_0271020 [Tanacetum coccineum]
MWLGLCLLEEALACDRKATFSDAWEEDDVFWMSCSKTLRLLYKSSIDSVSIFFFVLIVMARLSHAGVPEDASKQGRSIADIDTDVEEPSEFRVPQEIKPSSSKDKGKGIMIEPEVPLKRKDQIALDEQIARDIQAKLDAELLEEQKLARKQEEEANIALIESWENTQAMMEADRLLAERLQSKEREELTDEEKAKLFIELMEKRRKHFAALRAQEKRNKPPTKAQKRTQMSTYLKHMGGYTYKQLKGKSFDEIQKLFDKEMKRVNTFVAMGSEVQENKEKKEEGREETTKGSRKKMLRRKRAEKEHQKESLKKQKVEEEKESEEVEEDDEVELKKLLVIKKDEDIAIDAIPLATKLPMEVQEILFNDKDATRIWNNAQRVNHQNFAKKTHPCAKKNMVPRAVLMKSGLVSVNIARQVNAAH